MRMRLFGCAIALTLEMLLGKGYGETPWKEVEKEIENPNEQLMFATAYLAQKEYATAEKLCVMVLNNGQSTERHKASAYNHLGIVYLLEFHSSKERNLLDIATQSFENAASLDPSKAEFYSNLGCAYLAAQRFDKSIGAFHASLEIKPAQPLYHMLLGIAYLGNNECHQAIQEFSLAAEFDGFGEKVKSLKRAAERLIQCKAPMN